MIKLSITFAATGETIEASGHSFTLASLNLIRKLADTGDVLVDGDIFYALSEIPSKIKVGTGVEVASITHEFKDGTDDTFNFTIQVDTKPNKEQQTAPVAEAATLATEPQAVPEAVHEVSDDENVVMES